MVHFALAFFQFLAIFHDDSMAIAIGAFILQSDGRFQLKLVDLAQLVDRKKQQKDGNVARILLKWI